MLQCVIALVFGGILGWERESAGKGAGFRTQMLVCVAAMLFVRLGQALISDSAQDTTIGQVRADPIHIIGAIATGVSFLGAGSIFRDHDNQIASGLTTAASLLVTACIGVAIAIDRYIIAAGVTFLSILILHTLRKFEAGIKPKP